MTGHGGDIVSASELAGIPAGDTIDFSSNVNPLGPPEQMKKILADSLSAAARYPDSECRRLRRKLAEVHQLAADEVLVGSGSTEMIYLLARALRPARAAVFAPCYLDYWRASEQAGAEVNGYVGSPENGFLPSEDSLRNAADIAGLVWIGHPNNPSGWLLDRATILGLVAEHPNTTFVVDEAFAEFLQDCRRHTLLSAGLPRNLIVLRSLTKFFAVPGLRLGFAAAHPDVVRLLAHLKEPWTVNGPALEVGLRLYDDPTYIERTRMDTAREARFLAEGLAAVDGLAPFDSRGCFILVQITADGLTAPELKERLLDRGILIRDASNFRGLDGSYVRFAVKGHDDNLKLLDALRDVLGGSTAGRGAG